MTKIIGIDPFIERPPAAPGLVIFDDVEDEPMTPELRARLRRWFEEDVAAIRGVPMLIKPAVRSLFTDLDK